MENTVRTSATEPIKQGSYGLPETETTVKGPAWVYTRSSAYVIAVSLGLLLDS